MKIALVVHNYPPESLGGTEVHVDNLAHEFSRHHEVFVFTRTWNSAYPQYDLLKEKKDKIQVTRIVNRYQDLVSFEMYYRNPIIDRIFKKWLEEVKPDVLHIQQLLNLSCEFINIAKELGIPVVMTLHDYWYQCPRIQRIQPKDLALCSEIKESVCADCLSSWFQPIDRMVWMDFRVSSLILEQRKRQIAQRNEYMLKQLSRVNYLIFPSYFMMRSYQEFGIPREKCLWMENGVCLDEKKNRGWKKHNPVHFGFIGTFIPTKGAHVLLEAFCRLPKGKAELHLYGQNCDYEYHEGYFDQIFSYKDHEGIFFHGEFQPEKLREVHENIDVLVVPSIWYENSPIVIQEALRNHIPVIASNIGGIPEKVVESKNGFLFSAGNVEELTERLNFFLEQNDRFLLSDPDIYPTVSMTEYAEKLVDLYSSLLCVSCT